MMANNGGEGLVNNSGVDPNNLIKMKGGFGNNGTIMTPKICKASEEGEGNNSARSSPSEGNVGVTNGNSSENKLFVGGLSWKTTPETLKEYFSQFGPITDVVVMMDPITRKSRGFGFLTFTESTAVPRALSVPIHMLDGKMIDPKHATPRSKPKPGSMKTKKMFVGGVSQETSLEEVKAYFLQFGKIEEAVMLKDHQTDRHRGFGFVTFHSVEVVDRICEMRYHTIKGKKAECKKAHSKETTPVKRSLFGSSLGAQGSLAFSLAAATANYSSGLNFSSLGNYRYSPYPLPYFLQNTTRSNALPSLSTTPAYGAYVLPNSANVSGSGLPNLNWPVYNPYV